MKKTRILVWSVWIFAVICFLGIFQGILEGSLEDTIIFIVCTVLSAIGGWFAQKKYKKEKEREQQRLEQERLEQERLEQERLEEERLRQAQQEAAAARRKEYEATHRSMSFSVAGVTFAGRQRPLAAIYKNLDGICDGSLEQCEYQGDPAVRVFADGEHIGFIPKNEIEQVLPIIERVDDVTIHVDSFYTSEGKLIYSAKAHITYQK